jgi:hypothetical protein
LQINELLGKPIRSLHSRFEASLEILFDVGVRESVHYPSGEIFVWAAKMNVDDTSIGLQGNLETAFEGIESVRGPFRISLRQLPG